MEMIWDSKMKPDLENPAGSGFKHSRLKKFEMLLGE
jgi:hypothetical protein